MIKNRHYIAVCYSHCWVHHASTTKNLFYLRFHVKKFNCKSMSYEKNEWRGGTDFIWKHFSNKKECKARFQTKAKNLHKKSCSNQKWKNHIEKTWPPRQTPQSTIYQNKPYKSWFHMKSSSGHCSSQKHDFRWKQNIIGKSR